MQRLLLFPCQAPKPKNMRHHLRAGHLSACLLLCLALTLLSCHKNISTPATSTPLDLPPNSYAVTNSANEFAFTLFQSTLKTEPTGSNMLISPLSVYMALSMTYNGAAGATRDSMALALQQSGIPISQLNAVSKALITQLPKEDSKVQLSIANSIFYSNKGPQPAPDFLDSTKTNYLSAMQAIDVSQPAAALNTINAWVAKNTKNKIPAILDQLDPYTLMVLVNAIYFNAPWLNSFKPAQTRAMPFSLAGGSTVSTPFMNQEMTIRSWFGPTFTLAELPYSTGKGFAMYVVLPNDPAQSITDFAASFKLDSLSNACAHLDSSFVSVSLPKWEYSYSITNMKRELTALGMGIAFGDADFSKMYPTASVSLSQVAHKTYIKVSEEGTEAAAATAVTVELTSAPMIRAIKADHPFLYVIAEKQTGTVLFVGIVNDPTKN